MKSYLFLILFCGSICLPVFCEVVCGSSQKECEMGRCINGSCVCDFGWTGETCNICHGRVLINQSSGYIIDGSSHYSNMTKCSWLIQPAEKHKHLRLVFNEMATECGWDYLYIYDGDSAFSPLLATYNGLISTKDNKNPTELLLSSGTAFLQFYSDVAYSLIGFNISYSIDDCPYDCYRQGDCENGVCNCQSGLSGSGCQCSDTCHNSSVTGTSECNGPCQTEGKWSLYELEPEFSRASFAIASVDDDAWMYGGYLFQSKSVENWLFRLNKPNRTNVPVTLGAGSLVPEPRYGHTMAALGQKLFVFGGKLLSNETFSNELWEFNTNTCIWKQIEYKTSNESISHLLYLFGHSSHFVKSANNSDVMIVIFGYHRDSLNSPFIFEYYPSMETWLYPRLTGSKVVATFGHSSVYDITSNSVYIHGGYNVDSKLLSSVFLYNPTQHQLIELKSSGFPRFLHSAVLLDGLMFVFGGNTHNDTNKSTGALCYSNQLLMYNLLSNSWKEIDSPDLLSPTFRYGQQATSFPSEHEIFFIGGYDSRLVTNFLVYKPTTCASFNQTTCTQSSLGCCWNQTHCVSTHNRNPENCSSEITCESLSYRGCSSCLAPNLSCTYCPKSKTCHSNTSDTDCERVCSQLESSGCKELKTCDYCNLESRVCEWKDRICVDRTTSNEPQCDLNSTCGFQSTCEACSKKGFCIWCLNLNQCIPSNSYVIQYPYGQCFEWSNNEAQCQETICTSKKSCFACQSDSRCGWCDDGTNTGLGSCLIGAGRGPLSMNQTSGSYDLELGQCPSKNWYFTSCPLCQCNGHSYCDADYNCINCSNNTTGENCESCSLGYFGNSENGGVCKACQCGSKAKYCHTTTGKCFCESKGSSGFYCDQCNRDYIKYQGTDDTCYYRLTENFQFTFTLDRAADLYTRNINFLYYVAGEGDVEVKVESNIFVGVNVSVFKLNKLEHFRVAKNVSKYDTTFNSGNLSFSSENNATILVHVQNLTIPCQVKVSLTRRSNRLLHILLILFSSFLGILLIAAVSWKVKMVCDTYRIRANRAVELKQMAARPFAGLNLNSNSSDEEYLDGKPSDPLISTVCQEKCVDNASILTTVLWLPVEKDRNSVPPMDQSAFVFGSVLASTKGGKEEPQTTYVNLNQESFLKNQHKNLML